MKIPEWVYIIFIGLLLITAPFIRILPKEASELVKIRATLNSNPEFYYGSRHSYGTLELVEHQHRNFEFRISRYSLNSLQESNFFEEAKTGTQLLITISKRENDERIKNLSYPEAWSFVNTYISVYGIESDDKMYSSFNDYNAELAKDNKIFLSYFPLAGTMLIIGYFLWKRKKRR